MMRRRPVTDDGATISPTRSPAVLDGEEMPGLAPTDYPSLYIAADTAAMSHHHRHLLIVQINLLLVALAAIIAVAAPLVPAVQRWSLTASALILAVGFAMQVINRRRHHDHDWFDDRALAEATKAATWRYVCGAAPYDVPTPAAGARFTDDLRHLVVRHRDVIRRIEAATDEATWITPGMRRVRALPLAARRSCYLRDRIDDQIIWYTRKAAHNRRVADRLFWLGQVAQAAAVLGALWRITYRGKIDVVPLLTALTAVVTAWSQTGRHMDLARSYAAANRQLVTERDRTAAAAEAAFGRTVADVEGMIAGEQTTWVTKRA